MITDMMNSNIADMVLDTGINTLTTINKMAKLIATAETEEDIIYILKTMQEELNTSMIMIENLEGVKV